MIVFSDGTIANIAKQKKMVPIDRGSRHAKNDPSERGIKGQKLTRYRG